MASLEPNLLPSRILPSVWPKVTRSFTYGDLKEKCETILLEARRKIITHCSLVEVNRDIKTLNDLVTDSKASTFQLKKERNTLAVKNQKKISFHKLPTQDPKPNKDQRGRQRWRKEKKENRRLRRQRYRRRRAAGRREVMKARVEEISKSVVRNLSSQEIPDEVYLFLDKGLNFVEAKSVNKQDLLFDTKDFLRKLAWKGFFFHNTTDLELEPRTDGGNNRPDLHIPSRSHPDFSHPALDDVRTRLLGYVKNLDSIPAKRNTTNAERQGKNWLLKKVRDEVLFVTKADKGGATLILDYDVVLDTIQEALNDASVFERLDCTVDEHMTLTTNLVKDTVRTEHAAGRIDNSNKKLITGLNERDNMVTSPVFRTSIPYVYPLFKIHKLKLEEIENHVTPPARLVHATRQGPFYRLEKWLAPELSELSRMYCGEEFILDSDHLLGQIDEIGGDLTTGTRLFTLDVIALYPSIDPSLALEALDDALRVCRTPHKVATTVRNFTVLILRESFVTFEGSVYKGVRGIPTGNCISRQIADITLHYLLFIKLPGAIPKQVTFWRRFIDDVLGFWRGTERSFSVYIDRLNSMTAPLGIVFGDSQIGTEVNYLDIKFNLSNTGLDYTLFRKETDARLYLKTDSFHPQHVFRSVVMSQMIRVVNRNSRPSPLKRDLDQLKRDLMRSGHEEVLLEEMEPLAKRRATGEVRMDKHGKEEGQTLIFSTLYYEEVDELRALVRDCQTSIDLVTGTKTRVIIALRKGPTIGSEIVRNRAMSVSEDTLHQMSVAPPNQKCGGKGCKTCPLMFEDPKSVTVNGSPTRLDMRLTCKAAGVIYVAKCTICEECYFGQTHSPFHIRINGHRSKFKTTGLEFEQSALAYHMFLKHRSANKDDFTISNFKVGIVKSGRATDLDRLEEGYIDSYGTRLQGLNRIAVVR